MDSYDIFKEDNVTQRDITARFFYLGNDSLDEKNNHFDTNAVLNGSSFGV
jgi:hypothetical protein